MLAPNTILQNRYRVVRELGHGGMGTVYEAVDQETTAGWDQDAGYLRLAARAGLHPVSRNILIGFRVVAVARTP
jgi:serine/threonine protein kinase